MSPAHHGNHRQSHRGRGRSRRPLAIAVIVAGVVLFAVNVPALFSGADEPAPAPNQQALTVSSANTVSRATQALRDRVSRVPEDAAAWAELGTAYVEQARSTGDPSYYTDAAAALKRSLRLQPDGNAPALIGMGVLSNARHEFSAARTWGERARAVQPDTAEVYAVLTDAHTQLGESDAATAALQRMLDLRPGVSSFTRASYDFELHGRTGDARRALQRALTAAARPSEIVFCRYYLGELAFNSGQLEQAAREYDRGLLIDPQNVPLLQGKAKVDAARGDTTKALAGFRDIVARVPLPEYLREYAALLRSAGQDDLAEQQFEVLTQQQRLLAAAGGADALEAAQTAAAQGDEAEALRQARREWGRRQHVAVADTLAWALHLNGRDAEALTYADRAAALGGRNAGFAYHRGMILASLGRGAEAVDTLEQALRINPHFSPLDAPKARQALARLRDGR